jgi:hypothetical protein
VVRAVAERGYVIGAGYGKLRGDDGARRPHGRPHAGHARRVPRRARRARWARCSASGAGRVRRGAALTACRPGVDSPSTGRGAPPSRAGPARPAMPAADAPLELLPGTADVLVLRTLVWGPMHGFAVASWIRQRTDGALSPRGRAAVQGAPPPRAAGVRRGRVGAVGAQPAGALLPADARRAGAPARRDGHLAALRRRRVPRARPGARARDGRRAAPGA